MVEPDNTQISRSRQCALVGISRSSTYYQEKNVSKRDLQLMKAIDQQYLKTPYYGRRRMCLALQKQGYHVSEKKVRRLMQLMGIRAIAPAPYTSRKHPGHKVYPYLLGNCEITRPNQVWCSDITYITMNGSFMYLCVIMDWYSRKVLSWSLSNTLDADFCISCLERAISAYGTPEIFNSDQGVQYTSESFTSILKEHGIAISMDGKGRFLDNIFIERLWRSLKYELIYLMEFISVSALRTGLANWFTFYNEERFHQGLSYKTPDEIYQMAMAA
jgi:putative transposase